MVVRTVLCKVKAVETAEGEGAIVKRVFPTRHLRSFDPFPLLDEFDITPPAGFPEHPHGGFEAVTYMLEGGFHHRDSLGNDSIVMAGGAQRFTTGKTIVHSELPGTEGVNRGLQLWVRLPVKLQGLAPTYQQVDAKDIPEKRVNGNLVRIVVGENSPVTLQNEVIYFDVTLQPKQPFTCEVRKDFNAFIYVLEGTVKIGDTELRKSEAALLTEGDSIGLSAADLARVVVIGGKPHGEDIILRGSFVY
ncbi:pirin family protein [Candidatus Bathyarchaeota archaeon A05DMB-2]|nr:pirin family protein [Candidatus Bathyarchaeota archaeon A05DMB-2]